MSFEFSIALRYLKSRRHGPFAFLTTLIAIGGVTLGVAALIVTLAFQTGFRTDIREKTLGIQPHIILFGTEKDTALTIESLGKQIALLKEVEGWAPFLLGQTLIQSKKNSQGILIKGILPDEEFQVTGVKKTLISGDWNSLRENSERFIVLGKELARSLAVSVGDEILVFSPTEMATLGGLGSVPKIESYRVGGIFQAGMYDYDANLALISLSQAQKLFKVEGATGLGIRVARLESAEKVAEKIAEIAGPKYWARSWLAMNRNLFEALKLEKLVMTIILAMIILVASFTIVSNLILISIEKSRDIGILRAIGASSSSIQKIFLYAGMTLGTAGILLGTILGIALVKILSKTQWIKLPADIYYLDTLPAKLSAGDLLTVLVCAFVITTLSAIYPALQAAKVNPGEAIRYG